MSWDPFQREVLAELGHVLYQPLAAPPAEAADVPDAIPAGAPVEADEAMLARLAHATGLPVELLRGHPRVAAASARLRGDAAAKRALWPALRALRRGRR